MEQTDMFPNITNPEEKKQRICKHPNKCLHGYCLNKICQAANPCVLCRTNARNLLQRGWK